MQEHLETRTITIPVAFTVPSDARPAEHRSAAGIRKVIVRDRELAVSLEVRFGDFAVIGLRRRRLTGAILARVFASGAAFKCCVLL